MKINIIILAIMSSFVTSAFAQDIEQDDMYFNSKDRAKLNATRKSQPVLASARNVDRTEDAEDVNPTDSYSARNVNPEYTSREQSQSSQADDENYFVNDYRYNQQSGFNQWNNNYNNWYNNPWYSSAYYGSSINSWNTPYYGSYYDAWGNPWRNPYYQSGWSSSFSYHWGNPYNYGWGSNYNYGCPMNNSWNAWGPSYYNSYGSYWNPYNRWNRYPTTVIIVENGGRGPVYGKRASRGTTFVNNTNNRTRSTYVGGDRSGDNGGRVTTGRQEEYYNRTRSTSTNSNTSTTTQQNRTSTQNNRSWSNDNSSSWGNSSSSSPSYSAPSRSSNTSGGTRSHSSSSGSGTNGRSRGRD